MAEHSLQRDKSPYAYSWNNPIRYNDPTGLYPVCGGYFERYVGGFFNYSVNRTQQNVQTAVTNAQTDAVTMVKEEPGALDYVTMGAAGTTIVSGTIAATTVNPVAGTVAGVVATTALVSEGTAVALSGIDAAFLGGDVAEFQSRFILFGVGLITGQSVKFGTNRALLKQGRGQANRKGAAEAAGTTGTVIIQEIIKEDDDERNQ
jgi:hypothetical protein